MSESSLNIYTIKDIAKLAGVSTGTVSRAINNADNMDLDLHRRIMHLVDATGYLKNRSKRPGRVPGQRKPEERARKICVVSPEMMPEWENSPLWTAYLAGVTRACQASDVAMEVRFGSPQSAPEEVARALAPCGGVLVKTGVATPSTPSFLSLLPERMPVVGFGAYQPLFPYPQVALDNRAAGMALTEYLLGRGHRRIAFVNPEPSHRMFTARMEGYREAMRTAGHYDETLAIELPRDGDGENGVPGSVLPERELPDLGPVVERLLALDRRPTAVIFANDWNASAFCLACQRASVAVPGVFSVCGVDNEATVCTLTHPQLTSFSLPFSELAEFATLELIGVMDGEGAHRRNQNYVQYLSGAMVGRESVADATD